jgi:hypothetical protein
MPYEYPTAGGVPRLLKAECRWAIEFDGCRRSRWTSPNAAAKAVARHSTALAAWDRSPLAVSDDLLRLWPIGDNL